MFSTERTVGFPAEVLTDDRRAMNRCSLLLPE
jgi:hypothetical protein